MHFQAPQHEARAAQHVEVGAGQREAHEDDGAAARDVALGRSATQHAALVVGGHGAVGLTLPDLVDDLSGTRRVLELHAAHRARGALPAPPRQDAQRRTAAAGERVPCAQ